jgi:serine/threonine-protein kinase RsbW
MNQVQEGDIVRLDLPASYKYLNVVSSCLAAVLERLEGVSEREMVAYNVELAVHETCTNIVEHAYEGAPGRIEVAISVCNTPRQVVVEVHDTGRAFDMTQVKEPDLSQAHTNGYGLFLMHRLVDEVTYAPQSGNNHWRLVKNL